MSPSKPPGGLTCSHLAAPVWGVIPWICAESIVNSGTDKEVQQWLCYVSSLARVHVPRYYPTVSHLSETTEATIVVSFDQVVSFSLDSYCPLPLVP